jgi:hypothetical protein
VGISPLYATVRYRDCDKSAATFDGTRNDDERTSAVHGSEQKKISPDVIDHVKRFDPSSSVRTCTNTRRNASAIDPTRPTKANSGEPEDANPIAERFPKKLHIHTYTHSGKYADNTDSGKYTENIDSGKYANYIDSGKYADNTDSGKYADNVRSLTV